MKLDNRALVTVGCLAAGVLIAAATPPWGWWPAAFLGIAVLDRLIADQPTKRRFLRGWLVGICWVLPSTLWMNDLTLPGWIAAGTVLPAYYGIAMAAVPGNRWRWLALPGAMALAELARWSFPFGGVPLSTIPMGQAASPLAPTVRLFGSLLLVVLVATIGVAISAATERAWKVTAAGVAIPLLMIGLAAIAPRADVIDTLDVAIVQGGGPQRTRAAETDERVVIERHLAATQDIDGPVDLIVWPENVVNVEGRLEDNREFAELQAVADDNDAVFVPGIVEGLNADDFRNASVVFVPGEPEVVDFYDKVLRVPFGEYVPLRGIVAPLSGGSVDRFIPREATIGDRPAILSTPLGRLGISISWEIFFDHRSRDAIGNGGEILLNPTNGSSYWLTIVQSQQVASSRLRALETDRWVLQAAPTGFSALIDPDGNVLERSAVSERRVIQGTPERRTGLTLANRLGAWPMLIASLLAVGAAQMAGRQRSNRSNLRTATTTDSTA